MPVPGSGVRLGRTMVTPGAGSKESPIPACSAVGSPVFVLGSKGEWHPKQCATPSTRYFPRATRSGVAANWRSVSGRLNGRTKARGLKWTSRAAPPTITITRKHANRPDFEGSGTGPHLMQPRCGRSSQGSYLRSTVAEPSQGIWGSSFFLPCLCVPCGETASFPVISAALPAAPAALRDWRRLGRGREVRADSGLLFSWPRAGAGRR